MASQRLRPNLTIPLAFLALGAVTFLLLFVAAWLENVPFGTLKDPIGWLEGLDSGQVFDVLGNAGEVVAGVLAIAITVVAIVVELAANRYSHEITGLFLRDPWNLGVLGMFVVTALMCVWVAATLTEPRQPTVAFAGFGITLILVTASLLALLPYFAYVVLFISPISVIRRIGRNALRSVSRSDSDQLIRAVDELQDVARSAIGQGDRGVAMACVTALARFSGEYEVLKPRLAPQWFDVAAVRTDPDFVALEAASLKEIEEQRVWVEVKVMRQYLALLALAVPASRDVANLIGISTKELSIATAEQDHLLNLHIRCFNSFIRATLNARDPRTAYYLMNQYRLLAEHLQSINRPGYVQEISGHLCYYGQLAHSMGMPFLAGSGRTRPRSAHHGWDKWRLRTSRSIVNSAIGA